MLSTALAGCAHLRADPPAPIAVAVAVKDLPPAALLACPAAPDGFPADAQATMPPAVRFAAIRLATAYAALRDQLGRLIDWNAPGTCTESVK